MQKFEDELHSLQKPDRGPLLTLLARRSKAESIQSEYRNILKTLVEPAFETVNIEYLSKKGKTAYELRDAQDEYLLSSDDPQNWRFSVGVVLKWEEPDKKKPYLVPKYIQCFMGGVDAGENLIFSSDGTEAKELTLKGKTGEQKTIELQQLIIEALKKNG